MIVNEERQKVRPQYKKNISMKSHRYNGIYKRDEVSEKEIPLSRKSLSEGFTILQNLKLSSLFLSLIFFLGLVGTKIPYSLGSKILIPLVVSFQIPKNIEIETSSKGFIKPEVKQASYDMDDLSYSRKRLYHVPFKRVTLKEEDEGLSIIANHYAKSISTIISFNYIKKSSDLLKRKFLLIPEPEGILYTVPRRAKRDHLQSLLKENHLDFQDLLEYNPYLPTSFEKLETGQVLFLPGVSLSSQELYNVRESLYIYPVVGPIIKNYGMVLDPLTGLEEKHFGIDIKGEEGSPVRATFDGRVDKIGFDSSYGNYIILTHPDGFKSLYAHLKTIDCETNKIVQQGKELGTVGKSGYAKTAHLHFSLLREKNSVDPMDYLH